MSYFLLMNRFVIESLFAGCNHVQREYRSFERKVYSFQIPIYRIADLRQKEVINIVDGKAWVCKGCRIQS